MTRRLCTLGFLAMCLAAGHDRAQAQVSGRSATPRTTNLRGARDQPGLFTQRLVLPPDFCGPIHVHDRELHGLVLRGVLLMGMTDSAGPLEVREHAAGSFVVVPARRPHVEGSVGETEIHLSGIGPVGTIIVDSLANGRCGRASGVDRSSPRDQR